jgi:hypothetical protein
MSDGISEAVGGRQSVVPCETCGTSTQSGGTKRCDACFEVESRLKFYLARGGENARQFVEKALLEIRVASLDADEEALLVDIEEDGSIGLEEDDWVVAERLAAKGFIRLGKIRSGIRRAVLV